MGKLNRASNETRRNNPNPWTIYIRRHRRNLNIFCTNKTQVGNYTFISYFGGQTVADANPVPGAARSIAAGDYYQPSTSATFTLTVQQDSIPWPPVTPLPNTYWTRPIYGENNNWYTLSGNWLGLAGAVYNATSNYNPYTLSPKTAHILWTKPEAFGGMIGGEFGGSERATSTQQPSTK